jgi:hypothetical protein
MEKVVLAQIAYRAYGNWVEWKLPGGKPLPAFGQLPMYIQNAWTAASETVAIQVRKDVLSEQPCADES